MRHLSEFQDPALVRGLLAKASALGSGRQSPLNLMEVCGGHTTAIRRNGLDVLLKGTVNFLSGPGCPVCVTAISDIDRVLSLAASGAFTVCTFGDLFRVPGTETSLMELKARGADVRVVYSVRDVLAYCREEKAREFVFAGIGFETTAPSVAAALLEAKRAGIGNFSVYCLHKTVPLALRVLLEDPDSRIEGFLLPGHVSAIIGLEPYAFIPQEFGIPGVVSGFEPADVLSAVVSLLGSMKTGKSAILNAYTRVVRSEGNPVARAVMDGVFEPCDAYWRGFGMIPASGLRIRAGYADFDIEKKTEIRLARNPEEFAGCLCGEVLRGKKVPSDCGLFGTACTPEHPRGSCMVSSEGVCAAWHLYGGRQDV